MTDWKLFQGSGLPHDAIQDLPDPPNWRSFVDEETELGTRKQRKGETYQAKQNEIEMVNAALYLRRPLLITGKPGTGKSSLAFAVAHELKLGEVLYWPITSRSSLKDGLYLYDAIGRLQDAQQKRLKMEINQQAGEATEMSDEELFKDIGNYIQLGPLGTALLPSNQPRVLLIDEIDKSDIDLPNDLLHVFEEGEFDIPELVRIQQKVATVTVRSAYKDESEPTISDATTAVTKGRVRCQSFPFVIMTSNGERDFPAPFLRRCLRLTMHNPEKADLEKIVKAHLDETALEKSETLIQDFLAKREDGELSTDQLLNAIYLVTRERSPHGQEKKDLVEQLLKYLTSTEDL